MIILDTCALVYDALFPEKLTRSALQHILHSQKTGQLYCCDISLWEIGMLIVKKRLDAGTDTQSFLELLLQARQMQVLSITPEIAALATSSSIFNHGDPADRIIAATTLHHKAKLITCDKNLREISGLSIVW